MARSFSVLIADTEPQGLESLVQGFKGCDWNVTACPSLETVPLLLKASGAQIVVMISRDNHEKAISLLDQIQGSKGNERLGCLMLAPESTRVAAKANLTRGFLATPTFVADVVCASEILVAAQAQTSLEGHDEPTIEFPIPTRGPLSFIRTMCALGRSGSVTLENGGKRGELLFLDGEITSAQFGPWQGTSGAHHMLTWNSGLIRLQLRPVARRGQLGQTANQFIEEADRFRRDFEHQLRNIGPRNTVFSKTVGKTIKPSADVPTEIMPVLQLCDGNRSLAELLNESPFRLMDTIRILGRLLDLGAISRRVQPVAIAPIPATHDSFWETARITNTSVDQVPSTTPLFPQLPQPDPPAALPEVDQRSTIQPRRKDRRRIGSQTLTIGAPANITGQSELELPKASSSSGELSKVSARDPITATPEMGPKTSGTIEMGAPDRRSRTNLPAVKDRPSIVVAIQEEDTKQSHAGPAPALIVPTAVSVTPPPQGPGLDASTITPPPIGPATPPPQSSQQGAIPAHASGEMAVGRITGVMQVAASARTARITATRPAMESSIQLDSSLLADTKTPEPAPETRSSATPSLGSRITGVLQTSPSKLVDRKRANESFHIDPSLTEDAPSPSRPRSGTPALGSAVLKPATNTPSRPRHPTPVASEQSEGKSHISTPFNAVESDFFDREADLYKEEKVESFSDLDEKGRGAGKSRAMNKHRK